MFYIFFYNLNYQLKCFINNILKNKDLIFIFNLNKTISLTDYRNGDRTFGFYNNITIRDGW